VYHLAVLPELQRGGIGSRLMRELEDRFRERGALKVNLLVERRNARVAAFYERLGYAAADYVFMGKELPHPPAPPAAVADPPPGRAASGER
jgi:GNAT superfamily N-acetyltransferase